MLSFFADAKSELTDALGMRLDHPKVLDKLGNPRCKRFAAFVEDGIFRAVSVCGTEDDPAGDDDPTLAQPETMLAAIDKHIGMGVAAGAS